MRYRVTYFQCLCYLALPRCIVSMHLTRCVLWHVVCLFFLRFFLVFEAAIYANKDAYIYPWISTSMASLKISDLLLQIACHISISVAILEASGPFFKGAVWFFSSASCPLYHFHITIIVYCRNICHLFVDFTVCCTCVCLIRWLVSHPLKCYYYCTRLTAPFPGQPG